MHRFFAFFLICGLAITSLSDDVIRSADDLMRAVYVDAKIAAPFCLEGKILVVKPPRIFLATESRAICVDAKRPSCQLENYHPGDQVRIAGRIIVSNNFRIPVADCESIELLGKSSISGPAAFTRDRWNGGALDFRIVSLSGCVVDAYDDEVDPRFRILVLSCDKTRVQISINIEESPPDLVRDIIGREVRATGICNPVIPTSRLFGGRVLELIQPDDIALLDTPPTDLFEVPPLLPSQRISTEADKAFGRRKASGQVVAVYRESNALLKIDDQQTLEVQFAVPPPRTGENIEATGFPDANGYLHQLRRARWRPIGKSSSAARDRKSVAQSVKIRELLRDEDGHVRYNRKLHGVPISVTGIVQARSTTDDGRAMFYLSDRGDTLSVEAETHVDLSDDITVGTKVEVTGIFLMIVEQSKVESSLPQIRECILSLQQTEDVRILARPSWWTPARLAIALGLLFFLLLATVVWNLVLQRIVERRGTELAQNQLAKAEAEIKTMERTRLAVELHDSLAQNLTGIALELQTVDAFSRKDPDRAHSHLVQATRSLLSCRQELRNCLGDLRSDALEKSTMDEAIAITLAPHLGDVACSIRFAIPRTRLTENTALTILKIIRELTLNSIRHGKASHLKIAGAVEGRTWHISVRDDGCGFDPNQRPGVRDGHFGLQGVQERVQSIGGTLEINSTPGKGTRVSFSGPFPGEPGESSAASIGQTT